MTVSSMTRNKRRISLSKKYESKRKELKKLINQRRLNRDLSLSEHMQNVFAIQRLPRNSAPVRVRNRCMRTSRPRGYVGYFGLCGYQLREACVKGFIPGIKNASW